MKALKKVGRYVADVLCLYHAISLAWDGRHLDAAIVLALFWLWYSERRGRSPKIEPLPASAPKSPEPPVLEAEVLPCYCSRGIDDVTVALRRAESMERLRGLYDRKLKEKLDELRARHRNEMMVMHWVKNLLVTKPPVEGQVRWAGIYFYDDKHEKEQLAEIGAVDWYPLHHSGNGHFLAMFVYPGEPERPKEMR